MRTETISIYTFDELSDTAKEKAREWYRNGAFDYEWWDCTYEDAKTIANLLGIDIVDIWFSGFSCQGDGACFTGGYSYAKGSAKAVKDYAPQDPELHAIADGLAALQRRYFYQLEASVKHSGHYNHSGCTQIDVTQADQSMYFEPECAQDLKDLLRNFMDWIYSRLEAEYYWLIEDEQVDDALIANDYEFTVDGEPY